MVIIFCKRTWYFIYRFGMDHHAQSFDHYLLKGRNLFSRFRQQSLPSMPTIASRIISEYRTRREGHCRVHARRQREASTRIYDWTVAKWGGIAIVVKQPWPNREVSTVKYGLPRRHVSNALPRNSRLRPPGYPFDTNDFYRCDFKSKNISTRNRTHRKTLNLVEKYFKPLCMNTNIF